MSQSHPRRTGQHYSISYSVAIAILGVVLHGTHAEFGLAQAAPFPTATPTPPPSVNPRPTRTFTLPEVIQQVVQANRELQNARLDRNLQQQELKEAERRFDPVFTPIIGLGFAQSLSSGSTPTASLPTVSISRATPLSVGVLGGRSDPLSDRTTLNSSTQLQTKLTTRIGTQLSLTTDPLAPTPVSFTLLQPLLRGFGRTVNEAPINIARLTETKGALTLQQTLIDKITETITAYSDLFQQQESVRIQVTSLANQRYQLDITTALVNAGRRARSELIDIQQRIADGERALIEAQNRRDLANSALLQLMDTQVPWQIQIAPASVETLIQQAIARAQTLTPEALLQTAYQNRPDYRQATLDIETERLGLITARDNQRWNLDVLSTTNLGENSQTAASLVLSREFGNPRLETETLRRQVGLQKNQNRRQQLTQIIQTEVTTQLVTIQSTQQQIVAARQAAELAARQLAIAQERFKRGKTTIFEVTQKEATLTTAQNSELNARLAFLLSMAQLDRILGTTLEIWQRN